MTIDRLSAAYEEDGIEVISDISIQVPAGKTLAVLGRSGIGKSTLLNVIAGLLEPRRGTVRFDGKSPDQLVKNREIAYVFQDHCLLPWRTVRENISLPLELAKAAKSRDKRVDIVLEIVRLEAAKDKLPRELSGGMKTRVQLARAVVQRPTVLLLDEPFSNLDDPTKEELYADLQEIQKREQLTTILVTHNLAESLILSDRVAVMGLNEAGHGAYLKHAIDVDFERPRDLDLLTHSRFNEKMKQLREII